MDPVVQRVLAAVERGDWALAKTLLHPYLHWTDAEGHTIRGRVTVLARLAEDPPVTPPSSFELRDGQVYRWTEAPPTPP